MDGRVERWVRPEIRALNAYHVPDPGRLIKLDAMENPYTWPAYLRGEWLEMLQCVPMNRYPDPGAAELKAQMRQAFDIPAEMALLPGNGSDELIQLIAMAVQGPGRSVLAPEPSFSMYKMIATFVGMDYVGVPLRADDFSLDMAAMLAAIESHQPAVIFLAYPNNPTGNLFDEKDVEAILKAAQGIVVLDEAYTSFADGSFMSRLGEFDNLLVMRTVSKMGLAGLRLGLLAGPAAWLGEFDKLRLPYNINVLTQASARLALTYVDIFEQQTAQIRKDREKLMQALVAMEGVEAFPSAANFILLRVPQGRAQSIFDGIKSRGVLIKNLDGASPLLADCLRVTVGRPQENQLFLRALKASLASS